MKRLEDVFETSASIPRFTSLGSAKMQDSRSRSSIQWFGSSRGEGYLARRRCSLLTPTKRSVVAPWNRTGRASIGTRRAILLAAIAAEVKIKATLELKTPPDRKPLVDIILKSFREVEVAIGELPHKTMKAAVGRSLHEDDPQLFTAVKLLFTHRNHVAHRGEPPELKDARADVVAAAKLFDWLDSLPDSGPGDQAHGMRRVPRMRLTRSGERLNARRERAPATRAE
jgi:hypothetical protein